ncbi:MAG: TlyA family RNA methyltransferase [Oscillospiraceae bacterium]|jgi:23S rRNA (cytidine1920-2'-O)/16S rRNA (cytidine1409-2'-O)-methyltransferase|nr:TlyA family RNA methyltransferase [Oscillospiraceae bacterium]
MVTERFGCESREKARALIMAGLVYVNNQKADKPGTLLSGNETVELRGNTLAYVSRGGLKLEKAVELWGLSFCGNTCLDVGASTGGFTDCMLQNGAKKVYAVDVGYGQLAWKLRTDPRVVNLERANFRYITHRQVPEPVDFAGVDVSFISLEKILPVLARFLSDGGECVCLIKPQFEAGREKVGKKGVVRDIDTHLEVLEKILAFVRGLELYPAGLTYSPIRGPEGNIEYLLYLKRCPASADINPAEVAAQSHLILNS